MRLGPCISKKISIIIDNDSEGVYYRLLLFFFMYFILREVELLPAYIKITQRVYMPLYNFLATFITKISCLLFQPFYPDITVSHDYIINISSISTIQLQPGCTGLNQMIRMCLILLLYPINWRKKILLILPTLAIIFTAALVHFALLIPISFHLHSWFQLTHDYLTKILFFGFIFLCWLFWEKVRLFK